MKDPYTPVKFEDFIGENRQLLDGRCFLIVSAGPRLGSEGDPEQTVSVVASPMSMEMLRGMIMAAAYHHNVQEDSVDVMMFERGDDEIPA